MSPEISEHAFESAIEAALLRFGPDAVPEGPGVSEAAAPYGEPLSGGFRARLPSDYDRSLCLIPNDLIDFVVATQLTPWKKLSTHHGAEVKERFAKRVASEVASRGVLDVLRSGVKDSGCAFQLAYFKPASGLNEQTRKLYQANFFSVVRQVKYSQKNENSLDLVLFLNGLPLFTAELKNPLTGQTVEDAIRQYKENRDPAEPLLAYRRCLAHFAVDPDWVFVTTCLARAKTRFLPFNQGRFGGAGNPPAPLTGGGYATSYLWEETWSRDSILELVRQFIHEVEEEDEDGKKTGKRYVVFPRYQQLDAVRSLVAHARAEGAGQHYLIEHSAGSGKSYTIAWLAHHLATLHDHEDRRVFDSVVVVTDRRVLDRQLQVTVRQLEQTRGVVENIDRTSRQLKEALESGKTIIVTTLQKFPVISEQIGALPGKRFAVIVDEAHSSQSGESSKSLKAVLSANSLEEAEKEEASAKTCEEEVDAAFLAEAEKRGRRANLSLFAFTATPKKKTLELFGTRGKDGTFRPFHTYTMRQAIEEGFILDVLANYMTYKPYWRLLKKVETDPRYDRRKAEYLLKSFVELHEHAIAEKARIMVDHFATQSAAEIGGLAKAMVVTRSRLHAVRFKLAIDALLKTKGQPYEALVAFSGKVTDGGKTYTESGMNSEGKGRVIGEAQTAKEFKRPDVRFLIVANKFQTGFDQPLLHTMYVDKLLGDVNAVQTLSRLNRTHANPDKKGTVVFDFANEAEAIRASFQPYYETTLLSEATDPNLLYDAERRLRDFHVFDDADVERFAKLYISKTSTQDQLYAALGPVEVRYGELPVEERVDFRGLVVDFARLYVFLSQVVPFRDAGLEKLYHFARYLRRKLAEDRPELPREVQQNIDMESYRIKETSRGALALERKPGVLEPGGVKTAHGPSPEELEPLSRIIAELNERFGLNLGPEHRVTLHQMMDRLDSDAALDATARVSPRENVRLTFDYKVNDVIQEIVNSNFDLYKRITDDERFGSLVRDFLFDQYVRKHRQAEDLIQQGESKTLEFKSTLRWNLREDRKDDEAITHSVLKTIAAFLNTEGGDLLIGVADDGSIVGIEVDRLDNDDKFMRHLMQAVRNGLGDRASTCLDPKTQVVNGKTVCIVSCQKSPEPVFLKWKGKESTERGTFYVRSGPGTVSLTEESYAEYIRTRFFEGAQDVTISGKPT